MELICINFLNQFENIEKQRAILSAFHLCFYVYEVEIFFHEVHTVVMNIL